MRATYLLFGELSLLTVFSRVFTVVPLVSLFTSLVVLIFCGKKYFIGFWLIQLFTLLPNIYLMVNLENITVFRMINWRLYGSSIAGIVTHPSGQMIQYASAHYVGNMFGLALSAVLYPSIAIGLSYWMYSKLKSSLKGRVREWHS